jgi:hypothetical protein
MERQGGAAGILVGRIQHCFYLLDTLGVLLPEDLISNGNREHITGDVPGQSEWGGTQA